MQSLGFHTRFLVSSLSLLFFLLTSYPGALHAETQHEARGSGSQEFSLDDLLVRLYDGNRFVQDQGESLWVARFRGSELHLGGTVEHFERGRVFLRFVTASGYDVSAMVLLATELSDDVYWKIERNRWRTATGIMIKKPFAEPCPWYDNVAGLADKRSEEELRTYILEVYEEVFGRPPGEGEIKLALFPKPSFVYAETEIEKEVCIVIQSASLE